MTPTSVVVADDHEFTGIAAQAILAGERDLELVGRAGSGAEALALVEELQPDVLVVDYRLPDITGAEVCRRAQIRRPGLRVLVLTAFVEREVFLRAMRAGATGFLGKDAAAAEFPEVCRRIARGEGVLDPRAVDYMPELLGQEPGRSDLDPPRLTPRQTAVLGEVRRGSTNVEIAAALGISLHTVKTHLEHIYEALGCGGRKEAVRVAEEYGLLGRTPD